MYTSIHYDGQEHDFDRENMMIHHEISNEILEVVLMSWVFHLGLTPISLGLIPISGY